MFCGTYAHKTYADEIKDADRTAIESDLMDVDISEYPKDEEGGAKVLCMQEYCYSTRPLFKESYGVYVYVYNPAEREVVADGNTVNIATEYNADGEPSNYSNVQLILLDKTSNFRFYKFKLSGGAERLVLEQDYMRRYNKRRYDIAGIQLHFAGDRYATDFRVGKKYEWTGHAHGCGPKYDEESTLECTFLETETLHLEPVPTAYRPEGTNGKNNYTQDSLHSVWFAVPNEYIDKYGELCAVHATWLNAVIKPMLVTGNEDIYSAINDNLGVEFSEHDSNGSMHYGLMSEFEARTGTGGTVKNHCKYGFNLEDGFIRLENCESVLPAIYGVFYAGNGENSADTFTVSSAALKQCLAESKSKFGGATVLGKYSAAMFERVDNEITDIRITSDETFSITSEKISSTWERLWGMSHTEFSDRFDGIEAIKALTTSDFNGTEREVADRLYVDENDVQALKAAVQNDAGNTYYLFRYQVSDYESSEVKEGEWEYKYNYLNVSASGWAFKNTDTNAYFFKETVDLDFDVIDVTFKNGGAQTVIPAVMDPIDVVPAATPPVYTETDTNSSFAWRSTFGILALILLLIFLIPALPYVFKAIWFVISLPFKAVGVEDKENKNEKN